MVLVVDQWNHLINVYLRRQLFSLNGAVTVHCNSNIALADRSMLLGPFG